MPSDPELEIINQKKIRELQTRTEEKSGGTPVILSDKEFDNFIANPNPSVVDFWAEWCAPCRVMHPVIERLANKYAGKVAFGKLDVDESQVAASKYGIFSIPTFMIFKGGKVVDKVVGAVGEQGLEKVLMKHL